MDRVNKHAELSFYIGKILLIFIDWLIAGVPRQSGDSTPGPGVSQCSGGGREGSQDC